VPHTPLYLLQKLKKSKTESYEEKFLLCSYSHYGFSGN
jgi:hypothetical protein